LKTNKDKICNRLELIKYNKNNSCKKKIHFCLLIFVDT
jgi:hypothetical protein